MVVIIIYFKAGAITNAKLNFDHENLPEKDIGTISGIAGPGIYFNFQNINLPQLL